jgi:hypothetical protein
MLTGDLPCRNKAPVQEGWPNFGLVHTRKWRGVWKSATLFGTLAAGYALVFHVPFKQSEHVFVRPRQWHASLVAKVFGARH